MSDTRSAIAQDAGWALWYAREVLKGPFPAGEAAIAKDANWAAAYADFIKNLKK